MAALYEPFRYALATNATGTTFADLSATATEPSGDGVFDLMDTPYGDSQSVPSLLQLIPFGTNADNETFDMRVYGYVETVPADLVTDTVMYIPFLLLDVSVVLCARTFSGHAASTFLADTIVVNDGPTDLDGAFENSPYLWVVSCAEDMVASVGVCTFGARYIKFDFDADAGASASASANCLWRPVTHQH